MRSAAPVTQNHLSKPTDLMLQNATHLRKSAPWPPNISHDHVFCTAPATENASLQILFKCPMPAIVFGNATKPSRFAHFWTRCETTSEPPKVARTCGVLYILSSKCSSRHIHRHFFDILTSKSGPSMVCFVTFLPFCASASSFFGLFLFSDLLSSNLSPLSASALLCFSSVHCRKFDF